MRCGWPGKPRADVQGSADHSKRLAFYSNVVERTESFRQGSSMV